MYRLLVFVFSIVMVASWQPASAASSHVVELGKPTQASLEVIGKKPPKRFIQLDLGELRTRSALLPDGERDLKARIRLRNRRMLERQKAVTKTKRKKKKKKKNESAKTDDREPEANDEEAKENEAESEKAEKKVAKASKKKRKKKKRASKRNGGGSSKRPALNANPKGPVSIN